MLSVNTLNVVILSVVMLSIVTSVELLMTNFPTNYGTELMRGYQLRVSADRWQHWSQKCFAAFIKWKITNLLITQQPLKLDKKAHVWILRILDFFVYVWLNLKTIKFNLMKLATDFYWQPSYLLVERASLRPQVLCHKPKARMQLMFKPELRLILRRDSAKPLLNKKNEGTAFTTFHFFT
jgi:hypothetical protein